MMKTIRLIRKDVNFRSDPIRKKKWEECERNEWKAQVTRRSTADNLMEDNFLKKYDGGQQSSYHRLCRKGQEKQIKNRTNCSPILKQPKTG